MFTGHAGGDIRDERHRFRGVADVFVKSGGPRLAGSVEAQTAVGVEVEGLFADVAGWPGIIAAPLIRAGLENVGIGQLGIVGPFEKMLQKRQLNAVAVESPGLLVERDIAELLGVTAVPVAVRPRPHHQRVVGAR